jgi:hypothetical protein
VDELAAVEHGHLEIGDDEIGRPRGGGVERLLRLLIGLDLDLLVERERQPFEDLEVGQAVVDDGYGLAFQARLRSLRIGCASAPRLLSRSAAAGVQRRLALTNTQQCLNNR